MTTVHIGACAVELKGHADATRNEQDHDLVCAAISALTCTLAEVVRRAYVAGALMCVFVAHRWQMRVRCWQRLPFFGAGWKYWPRAIRGTSK